MVILAEILVQSYNGTKTIPFSVLEKQWKADDQIPDRGEIKQEHAALPQPPTLWNKDGRAKKMQDILNFLLQSAYPDISEGKGWTSTWDALWPQSSSSAPRRRLSHWGDHLEWEFGNWHFPIWGIQTMSGPDISATRKKWECISEVGNKVINGPEQEIPAHKNAGLQSVTSFLF